MEDERTARAAGLDRHRPHGLRLASRLLEAGHDVAVYNRTRAKAEPLAELGATIVDSPAELADRDIVFTMVAGPDDFKQVVLGERGPALARRRRGRAIIVDSTTISPEASAEVRREAARARRRPARRAGERQPEGRRRRPADDRRLRPAHAFERVEPYLRSPRPGRDLRRRGRARPAGEDLPQPDARRRRPVAGRDRGARREGRGRRGPTSSSSSTTASWARCSRATRRPAYVNLDFSPTFTPALLLKDFDLGFEAAARARRADAGRGGRRASWSRR